MDIDYEISERITGLEEQIAELRQLAGENRSSYEELKQSQNSTYERISELIEKMESDLQDELRSQNPECKNKVILDDLKIEISDLITKHSILSNSFKTLTEKVEHLEEELQEILEQEDEMMHDEPEHHESSGCKCGQCSGNSEEVRDLMGMLYNHYSIVAKRIIEEHERDIGIEKQNHEMNRAYFEKRIKQLIEEGKI